MLLFLNVKMFNWKKKQLIILSNEFVAKFFLKKNQCQLAS